MTHQGMGTKFQNFFFSFQHKRLPELHQCLIYGLELANSSGHCVSWSQIVTYLEERQGSHMLEGLIDPMLFWLVCLLILNILYYVETILVVLKQIHCLKNSRKNSNNKKIKTWQLLVQQRALWQPHQEVETTVI